MQVSSYLRPVGRVMAMPAKMPGAPERTFALAGLPHLAFMGFEAIERHADGWVDRRLVAVADLASLLSGTQAAAAARRRLIANLERPRADIAGLTLDRPRIMGIVNITPDSFSDGGHFLTPKEAIAHAMKLDEDGADILDIGGESTRPGADPVRLDEELKRVIPVIEGLAGKTRARLSIDTRKAEVMRRAAVAGVHLLNDVSALAHDPVSLRIAAETKLPVVLMHSLADPRTMQQDPRYHDVLLDVFDALEARIEACVRAGIPRERLIVDPGIGFGKTVDHNVRLLGAMALFHGLGTALLIGASRKSFIGALTGAVDPAERVPGSLAAAMVAVAQGAQILRVHDVAATRQAVTVWEAAVSAGHAAGLT